MSRAELATGKVGRDNLGHFNFEATVTTNKSKVLAIIDILGLNLPVSHYKTDIFGCFFPISVAPFLSLQHNYCVILAQNTFINFTNVAFGGIDASNTVASQSVDCL